MTNSAKTTLFSPCGSCKTYQGLGNIFLVSSYMHKIHRNCLYGTDNTTLGTTDILFQHTLPPHKIERPPYNIVYYPLFC